MTASTRRAALGAILAAPLASAPADAHEVSGDLARVLSEARAADRLLERGDDFAVLALDRSLIADAGRLRAEVVRCPARSVPDLIAKLVFLIEIQGLEDLEGEVSETVSRGHAYLADVAVGIVRDSALLLREGKLCA